MPLAKSLEEARAHCTHLTHADGRESWVSRFFTAAAEAPDGPVAFLVEKKAHAMVPPHFHEVDQFQVIVAGHGTLGKQAVQPFTVQYTNRYNGYGPICAAEEGIAFLTLRNRFDPGGARYFPAGRSFMKPAPKRRRVSGHLVPSATETLQSRCSEALETVFAPEPDGLAAWFMRLAPASTTQTPKAEQSGGQYVVVAGGTLHYDGVALPGLSCVYVASDEGPVALHAGHGGLEVLVVQFPGGNA